MRRLRGLQLGEYDDTSVASVGAGWGGGLSKDDFVWRLLEGD